MNTNLQELLPALQLVHQTRRRCWSDDEKKALVAEAQKAGNVSVVARRHGITPSQLFIWRKDFQLPGKPKVRLSTSEPNTLLETYEASLAKIKVLERLNTLAVEKLSCELRSGRLTAYTASCALSNVVNSAAKVESLLIETVEKLAILQTSAQPEEKNVADENERKVQPLAELLLAEVGRLEAENQKQAETVSR